MSSTAALQTLSESELRDVLALGGSEAWGEFQTVIAWAAASMLASLNRNEELRAATVSFRGVAPRGSDADLASQFVRLLVDEMKGVVGLGCSDGVLLLDRKGKVHGMNRAAEKLFESRFFTETTAGEIALSERMKQKRFRAAFELFCVEWPEVSRTLLDKGTLVIFRSAFNQSAVSLIAATFRRVQERIEVPLDVVQKVLDVSPKQAHLARAVLLGVAPVEYAKQNTITVKTARFHLYGLMRKLGCRTQIELMNYLTRTFE